MVEPVFTARHLSKAFGPVRALEDVSVSFFPGEIHAVLGENGAGKSTLMNVLAGFLRPDAGELILRGVPLNLANAADARQSGIEMVHQHFMLVPEFTVEENLALAHLDQLATPLRSRTLAARAVATAQALGWPLNVTARTGDLSVGQQQRVEILKALASDAEVLIFDEPTAVLGPEEVDDLFQVLRRLARQGKAIILIAHKLSEVLAVADRVTVLRRGRLVAEALIGDVDARRLAEWMVGDLPPERHAGTPSGSEVLVDALELVVQGDRGEMAVRSATFTVHRGEILGFGGVDGNGQVELAETLMGLRPLVSGTLGWAGGRAPRRAYIPQDRQRDGLALTMSVLDNFLIDGQSAPQLRWGPFLRGGRIRAWAQQLVERFQIRVGHLEDPVSSLSGGNQQKVVVSRALAREPEMLVVVNPTRGLDLQAAHTVHERLRAAASSGVGVVLLSTDRDELEVLAHRTFFLDRGTVRTDLASALAGSRS